MARLGVCRKPGAAKHGFGAASRPPLRISAGWKAFLLLALCAAFIPQIAQAQAVSTNPGFVTNSIPRNDDGSTERAIDLGFTVNFFGETFRDRKSVV